MEKEQQPEKNHPRDPNRRVLSLGIKDIGVLYTAYMPFVENGGLFIPMKKQLEIGEKIQILLALMDDQEKIQVSARVVWVTPNYAQGNKTPGVGVQFLEKENTAKTRIEHLLAEKLASIDPTHTM